MERRLAEMVGARRAAGFRVTPQRREVLRILAKGEGHPDAGRIHTLPVTNGQPSGAPSNTVKITYDPNGEIKISFPVIPVPVATYYDLKILNFTGVHVPEYKYQFCVEVVENNAPQGSLWAGFKPGTVLCPETYKGGSGNILDDLSNAVEDALQLHLGSLQ